MKNTVVFDNERFTVEEFQGRYYMLIDNQRVAELVSGAEGLTKYYKDDFEVWYEKIREKKINTIKSYTNQAERLLNQAEELRNVWGYNHNNQT